MSEVPDNTIRLVGGPRDGETIEDPRVGTLLVPMVGESSRFSEARYKGVAGEYHYVETVDVVVAKVIEQAASEASHVYRESVGNGKPGNPIVEQDRAFAGVVAAWARAEERERIREAIKARATEREAEMLKADRKAYYKDSPGWARIRDENSAMLDELQSLLDDEPALAALDWGEPA